MQKIKINTIDDLKNLLRINLASAALGTALELQLFERLSEKPLSIQDVSQVFKIPLDRCRCWLELLVGLNLLKRDNGAYSLSSVGRTTILDTYSSNTWAQLAQEARERYPIGDNLALHITHPKSVWIAQGISSPNWFKQIQEDPERARRFTYTLYELHQPLAETLAKTLDMEGVRRLMDLGGGSGVISLALLKQHPNLTVTVIDIPNVCVIGREIAIKTPVADRITYHEADFLEDELPTGFDMILVCDAGVYNEKFFRKLFNTLKDGGYLVIVDWWNPGITDSQPVLESSLQRLLILFEMSLGRPNMKITTSTIVKNLINQVGFIIRSEQELEDKTVIIRAQKSPSATSGTS
ncbi:MAG: methyltransferase [Candidatus Hodarchaeota archaeon]